MSASSSIPAEAAAPRHRGRQRCPEAKEAILSAAIELLEKKNLREVTAEAIAQRAGVSKATIYKWWPNKSLVALDAFLTRMQSNVATPNTGSARCDFTEQLQAVIRFFSSPSGRLYSQFIAEGQCDAEFFAQFRDRFLQARRDEVRTMWQRGIDRGEIRADIDSDVALDLVYGPTIFRLLTGHAPLNDQQAEALVAAAFDGLQA